MMSSGKEKSLSESISPRGTTCGGISGNACDPWDQRRDMAADAGLHGASG